MALTQIWADLAPGGTGTRPCQRHQDQQRLAGVASSTFSFMSCQVAPPSAVTSTRTICRPPPLQAYPADAGGQQSAVSGGGGAQYPADAGGPAVSRQRGQQSVDSGATVSRQRGHSQPTAGGGRGTVPCRRQSADSGGSSQPSAGPAVSRQRGHSQPTAGSQSADSGGGGGAQYPADASQPTAGASSQPSAGSQSADSGATVSRQWGHSTTVGLRPAALTAALESGLYDWLDSDS